MRSSIAKIFLRNLDNNIKELITSLKSETKLMAVVKANAYGHGAVEIAKQAIRSGAHCLGVALPEEGAELRESGITAPILVLGGIDKTDIKIVINYDLQQCAPSKDLLICLNKEAKKADKIAKVHLKVDTGMNRIGVSTHNELVSVLNILKQSTNLNLVGVFTHFASADESDKTFTKFQTRLFNEYIDKLHNIGFYPEYIHAANSAAVLDCPETHYNLVRPGISLYGYYPSIFVNKSKVKLMPVMQLETSILAIKEIEAGESISYGRSFYANRNMKIASLPIGYADGYKRNLSNRSHVLINGKKAPVVGRICMDQMMVDVTNIKEAKPGDNVVLLGKQNNESVDADFLANLCETISYEILSSISSRIKRVFIQ